LEYGYFTIQVAGIAPPLESIDLFFFSNAKGEACRKDFKEVQILFLANNKIPNDSEARKKNYRSQGKPK
jgi:hypothetical protein